MSLISSLVCDWCGIEKEERDIFWEKMMIITTRTTNEYDMCPECQLKRGLIEVSEEEPEKSGRVNLNNINVQDNSYTKYKMRDLKKSEIQQKYFEAIADIEKEENSELEEI